ncbi:DMT family transporter [Niallia sp. Krafla_26]|uniref:DMT family transporter n=1 Tax=Niallia sp. Krafla_26 TaxID=3064703 RepID=UPI003D1655E7
MRILKGDDESLNAKMIYLLLVGLTVVWGFNVSFVKILVGTVPPVTITAFRIFTAAITVFIALGLLRRVRLPKKSEMIYIIGGTFTGVVIHHYFLSSGLTATSATNAGLVLGMGPLLTVLLSIIFFRKRPSLITGLGFIVGGIGVSITVLYGNGQLQGVNIGDFQIFLCILSQAFSFILINKATKTMDSVLLTGYMLLFGSIMLFMISLVIEPHGLAALVNVTPSYVIVFLISAIMATGLGHMLYNYSISQVGAAEASIFLNLSTFFSVVGAALFLTETIHFAHFVGMIFIVSGVIMGSGTLEALLLQRKKMRQTIGPDAGQHHL